MKSDDPVFLGTFKDGREAFTARHPRLTADTDGARVLRSVLMKPESEQRWSTSTPGSRHSSAPADRGVSRTNDVP
ncbi:hypothetical protein [Streptomyces griseorubiginosus]|uniref:hypothetical protein n=1 Tax=Streptomyces griseorubiginosus TaxID=67304 RepID=UPI003663006D